MPHILKIAPMRVNTTSSATTVNAKYRARVALCKWDLVAGPWYREPENHWIEEAINKAIYDRGK
jgi:hypothetical protein